MFAIPTNTGLRKQATNGLIAMRLYIIVGRILKGQFYDPIVEKIQCAPGGVWEGRGFGSGLFNHNPRRQIAGPF